MEEQFALQDAYEISRTSISHTSGLMSPAYSKLFGHFEDATATTDKTSPFSNKHPPAITGYHTPPRSNTPSFADSELSSSDSPGKPMRRSRSTLRAYSLLSAPAPGHNMPRELPSGPFLTSDHRLLKMKLMPLAAVENQLLQELSIPAADEVEPRCSCPLGRLGDHKELIIRPLRGWEKKFERLRIGALGWLKEEPKAKRSDDPSHIISAW
jgi:hypothetical protein